MKSVDAGLADAMARLDRALGQGAVASVSFDIALPDPERELLHALAPKPVSFSPSAPSDAHTSVARSLGQLLEFVGATLMVETQGNDGLAARTTIDLHGDRVNMLAASATPADLARHSEAVERAQQARAERVRLVIMVARAAAKITLILQTANPLGATLMAWRFIRGVMAEREGYEELP